MKLFRGAKGYQPTATLKTYLFRIATNHCLNEVRRAEHRAHRPDLAELDAPAPASDGPEQALWGRELERTITAALAELSDRERAAFCMCRFEGMSYRDIALALETTEPAIKSLIHRATLWMAKKVTAPAQTQAPPQRSRA